MVSFDEKDYSHAIIDDIVQSHIDNNPDLYSQVSEQPAYYGYTSIAENKTKLNPLGAKKNAGALSFINDIIMTYGNLALDTSKEPKVCVCTNGAVASEWNTSFGIIKLIKACSVASYNMCKDYSDVVTAFTEELLKGKGNYCLPLNTPRQTKLQELISDELNDFLKSILDNDGISYTTVITEKGSNRLLKTAKIVSGEVED